MRLLNLALKYLLKRISLWHGIWANAYLRVFVYWVEKKESTYRRMLFLQCLFRNFCDFGLKAYSKDEELKKWFNLCIALAFVPPNKVEEIYVEC